MEAIEADLEGIGGIAKAETTVDFSFCIAGNNAPFRRIRQIHNNAIEKAAFFRNLELIFLLCSSTEVGYLELQW